MHTRRNFFQRCFQFLGIAAGWSTVESCTYDSIPPLLTLITPKSGETIFQQSIYKIEWEKRFVDKIDIELSRDGGENWNSITTSFNAALKVFEWEVSEDPSDKCVIRIKDHSNPEFITQSEGFFNIEEGLLIDLQVHTELMTIGNVKTFSGKFVEQISVLRQSEEEFIVLDLTCPHADCIVEWDGRGKKFSCPCHASGFDQNGCLLVGPADEPLSRFETFYDASQQKLWVLFKMIENSTC